jgi:hypothetical protein
MADTPAPQPGTIAYAEWKSRQQQQRARVKPGAVAKVSAQPQESKLERPDVRNKKPTSVRKKRKTLQRPVQRTKERLTERRPYDFFRDQILWLNKTKVEILERYGRRVTANAMVQLAVDLFMQDYKRRKERSKLVTKLVSNEPTEGRPSGRI